MIYYFLQLVVSFLPLSLPSFLLFPSSSFDWVKYIHIAQNSKDTQEYTMKILPPSTGQRLPGPLSEASVLLATEFQSTAAYRLGSELTLVHSGFEQLKTKCSTLIHHCRAPSKADLFQIVFTILHAGSSDNLVGKEAPHILLIHRQFSKNRN